LDHGLDGNGLAVSRLITPLRYGLLLVPLIFLGAFFFYPLLTMLSLSLAGENGINLSGFVEIATSSYFRQTAWFTVWQAAVSTLLTIGLALPSAYVFVTYRFPGKDLLLSLSALPFVLPTVVVAAAFTSLLGRQGVINSLLTTWFSLPDAPIDLERSLTLIFIAHVFYNYAIALRMIVGFWANQTRRIEDAARVLGASGWRLWWHIILPMIRPAVTAAALLVYIFTFTSFGVILLLGGVQFATLEVEIYRQVTSFFDLPTAAALSLVQISVMMVMMTVYTRLQARNAGGGLQSTSSRVRPPKATWERLLVIGNIALIVVLIFTPLAALIAQSLTANGELSTRAYTQLSETSRRSVFIAPPAEAIGNSLAYAAVTTVIAVGLGVLASYLLVTPRSWLTWLLDPMFMLPLATSAVTLGFGFIVALDEPPLNLRTSRLLIPVAHTLVALPFVIRSVLPALRSIPTHLHEAAQVMGANTINRLRYIDLPLASRGALVGATFAFTVSMGEFGATVFIARPETPTMPLVIFRLLGQPGVSNYAQAMAMSVILIAVCGVAFVTIERLRTAGIGEF
jgi:thiamine transport system permease protein